MAIPARIELPTFPAGKRIAFTTSWDDGTIHDRRLVAYFNQLGIKGTFNLNSGLLEGKTLPSGWHGRIRPDEVASLFHGHEVAVHTVTHPWLDRLDGAQIATEVLDDRKALEDLVGYPVRGMAYPFGTYNDRVINTLRDLGIVYSRTCENRYNPWVPAEPLAWPSTMHVLDESNLTLPERFEKMYTDNNRSVTGLFYAWGHSYEFETDNPRRNWSNLERLFQSIAGKPDVWYCTNIQLFDYESARQRLVLAANRASAFNPSAVPVTVKADNKLIEIPAGQTIRLDI